MPAVPSDGNYHLPVFAVITEDPFKAIRQVEEVIILRNSTFQNSGFDFHVSVH